MSDVPQSHTDLERALLRYRQAPESKLFAPLAMSYRASGRTEEAVRILKAGLERHPDYVSARVLLGTYSAELQREEEAEAAFARVLDADPENLAALRFRAERARRRGALDRAVDMLRQVLEIDPFDREVQADLGLLTTALERRARDERPEMRPQTPPPPERGRQAPAPPAPPAPAGEPAPPAPPAAGREPAPTRPEPSPPRPDIAPARAAGEAPAETPPPPAIDLRRVGDSQPETDRWRFTRDDDRIVVQPDTPVRGPIRSVEDRLWSEQQRHAAPPPAPAAPEPAPPERPGPRSVPPPAEPRPRPPARPAAPEPPEVAAGRGPEEPRSEFATLTLARIYESQGYYRKALAIYDEMQRQHPEDPEIAAALASLQRRLAGIPETPPADSGARAWPAAAEEPAATEEPQVEWRLLDSDSLEPPERTAQRLRETVTDLREHERQRRHTVVGSPPPAPAAPEPAPPPEAEPAPPEDVSRGHPDFERFMSYVRSLRRGGGSP